MRITSFVVREAIIPSLNATTRNEAIEEMVQAIAAVGKLPNAAPADVVEHVIRRESIGSTGIGHGIAIPHSRHGNVSELVATLAISRMGIPFDAIDGEPVYVLILLVSPSDQATLHLRALDCVVQKMKDMEFVHQLRACQTQDEIWNLLG
jgi:PTS system fructose-specific IIA component/PTS system nitrogen regulatory IIA component